MDDLQPQKLISGVNRGKKINRVAVIDTEGGEMCNKTAASDRWG